MPAVVGPIQVINVTGGVLQFGDTLVTSPKSASKTFNGSGSFNTGFALFPASGLNLNNIVDLQGIDQPIAGNN
ncbi:spore germination protein [Peribacillus sp. SCS-155]|uniref:spore germination protein n=1 Tax=Peribacillus sedimenti TaxID=3115297 RepID=UPI003905C189